MVDHHAGRNGPGGALVYSDPWERRKIDAQSVKSRVAVKKVIQDDVPIGRVHVQDDAEWTRGDPSNNYIITPRSVEEWQIGYIGHYRDEPALQMEPVKPLALGLSDVTDDTLHNGDPIEVPVA